jgi:hypothetical protein
MNMRQVINYAAELVQQNYLSPLLTKLVSASLSTDTISWVIDCEDDDSIANISNDITILALIIKSEHLPENCKIEIIISDVGFEKNHPMLGRENLTNFFNSFTKQLPSGLNLIFENLDHEDANFAMQMLTQKLANDDLPLNFHIHFRMCMLDYIYGKNIIESLQNPQCSVGIELNILSNHWRTPDTSILGSTIENTLGEDFCQTLSSGLCKPGIKIFMLSYMLDNFFTAMQKNKFVDGLALSAEMGPDESFSGKEFANLLVSGNAPKNFSINFPDDSVQLETQNEIIEALKNKNCPQGLSINFGTYEDDLKSPLALTIAAAIVSGELPKDLHLYLNSYQQIDIAAIFLALASGKAPEGLHLTMTLDPSGTYSNSLIDTFCHLINSRNSPDRLTLDLKNIDDRNASIESKTVLFTKIVSALEKNSLPFGLKINIINSALDPQILQKISAILKANDEKHLALQYSTLSQSKLSSTNYSHKISADLIKQAIFFNSNLNSRDTFKLLKNVDKKLVGFSAATTLSTDAEISNKRPAEGEPDESAPSPNKKRF